MAFGKHRRRKNDPPKWDDLTPEQKAKAFDANVAKHVTGAADKRAKGKYPYDQEPTSKKKRFGRRKGDK